MTTDAEPEVVVRVCPDDVPGALGEAARLLTAGRTVVVAPDRQVPVDLGTVGTLARLVLLARRGGGELVVRAPDDDLRRLAALAGLDGVLGLPGPGPRPGSGQAQR